uniref:DUF222 domain-containing protein n=1 Tax=Gryllotalpicola ginsengisoli TaxID=444608 RepID=UPI0005263FB3
MTVIGPAAADAMARLAALLPTDVSCLGPREFVAFLEATAEVRRQLDAIELVNAGEMTRRSADGPDSLARRLGYRTAADALEAVTGSSGKEARQLVRDSEEIAKLPHVAEAVLAGRIGRESAQAITQTLGRAAHDTDPV